MYTGRVTTKDILINFLGCYRTTVAERCLLSLQLYTYTKQVFGIGNHYKKEIHLLRLLPTSACWSMASKLVENRIDVIVEIAIILYLKMRAYN